MTSRQAISKGKILEDIAYLDSEIKELTILKGPGSSSVAMLKQQRDVLYDSLKTPAQLAARFAHQSKITESLNKKDIARRVDTKAITEHEAQRATYTVEQLELMALF
jgi:hypothetical protein